VSMRLSEVLDGVGRPIGYFPKLAKFLGGVKVYILFCQLFYWSQRTNGSAWFFKYALWSPDNLAERLKISAEMVELSKGLDDLEWATGPMR